MPINLKRSFVIAALVTVLIGSGAARAEVKVGFLGGFTGPLKSMTPSVYKAAKLAVKHVNDQGGVLDGQKIIMPNADTTCADTAAAAKAADSLVNSEKVVALVGALCSSATLSVAENVAIPAGVTMVSPASTSPAITSLNDKDLVFRTTPSDLYQGSVMARLLRSKGIDRIAITYVNNDYGKGFADALAAAFLAAGGKIDANEPHEEGKADYRDHIRSLASSGVETLVVLAYANGSGQTIIRQAVESGDFDQFVGGDGMVNDTLIGAIGADKLRGMIATKPGVPDTKSARFFKKLALEDDLNPTATASASQEICGDINSIATLDGNTGGNDLDFGAQGLWTFPSIWREDFNDLADGTTVDAGATAWSRAIANTGSGWFSEVRSQRYQTTRNRTTWTSGNINIFGYTDVGISLDLSSYR